MVTKQSYLKTLFKPVHNPSESRSGRYRFADDFVGFLFAVIQGEKQQADGCGKTRIIKVIRQIDDVFGTPDAHLFVKHHVGNVAYAGKLSAAAGENDAVAGDVAQPVLGELLINQFKYFFNARGNNAD